jgi:ABC-type transporter lipoprotein component MlaA
VDHGDVVAPLEYVGQVVADRSGFISPIMCLSSRLVPAAETNLSFKIEDIDELIGAAVDPYVAVRDAYIQSREKRV